MEDKENVMWENECNIFFFWLCWKIMKKYKIYWKKRSCFVFEYSSFSLVYFKKNMGEALECNWNGNLGIRSGKWELNFSLFFFFIWRIITDRSVKEVMEKLLYWRIMVNRLIEESNGKVINEFEKFYRRKIRVWLVWLE